jgi:hypothetical protein
LKVTSGSVYSLRRTAICSSGPPIARLEVGVQRRVLRDIPADADREAQPPAARQINLGRLLGDQRRRALRQHQHARHELEPARDTGEVRDRQPFT